MANKLFLVEFHGGPLDGFERYATKPLVDSDGFLALAMNTNVVRVIAGEQPKDTMPASSVAIYELDATGTRLTYRFVGATEVSQFHLERWTG